MRQRPLLYTASGFMAVVAVLHIIALPFSLYWTYWWFDIVMHFLAGFSGGLFILWFFAPFSIYKSLFLTLGYLLVVGVAWEIFEFVFDITISQPTNYWQDTIYDLINDTLGALLAYLSVYISARTPKSS